MTTPTTHSNGPIFIIGSGRSGTSVLTWCLGQHPNILALPETNWLARLTTQMRHLYRAGSAFGEYSHLSALDWSEADFYAALGRGIDRLVIETREPYLRYVYNAALRKAGLPEGQIPQLRTDGNYHVMRSDKDPKSRWVDGTPENTYYVYGLAELFPHARFIHLLRDPNDVARSLMRFSKAGAFGHNYAAGAAYAEWFGWVDAAHLAEQALGREKVLRIHYERLVQDPETAIRDCLQFVGEEFHADCLAPMREKINSSDADSTTAPGDRIREGRRANELYRRVLDNPPDQPQSSAMDTLAVRCRQQIKETDLTPPRPGARVSARLRWRYRLFRKAFVSLKP